MTATDELLPDAKALAARLGRLPGRNALKAELGIGSTRADRLRVALRALGTMAERQEGADEAGEAPPTDEAETRWQSVEPVPQAPQEADEVADRGRHAGAGENGRPPRPWALLLLALPAFVAVWSGWVELGGMTGFGVVEPLPGILDGFTLDTAIVLPIGVEAYAAYALRVWLDTGQPARARSFARASSIAGLGLGGLGQVAYHLLEAAGYSSAPWWITAIVATLPVGIVGAGAALAHLTRE